MNKRASVVSEEDSFYDLPTEDIPESEAADAMAASSNLRYFPRRPCHPEPQYADKCCLASTTTHISVGSPALITIRQKSCLQLEKNQRESVLSTPEGSRHDQVFKKGPRSKTSHEFTPMEGHKKRLYELSNPPTVPRPPKSLPKEYHPLPAEPLVDLQPKMPPSDFEEVTVRQQVKKRPIYTKEAPNVNDEALKKESQIFRKLGKELKTHLVLSRPSQCHTDTDFQVSEVKSPHEGNLSEKLKSLINKEGNRTRVIQPHRSQELKKVFSTGTLREDMKNYEWYSGIHTRDTAEQALLREQIDGSFVVRDSSIKSSETPYVLVIFYADKVYNIKIRYLEDIHQYALGSGLRGDDRFDSIHDIIEYHKNVPIMLIDGKDRTGNPREQCTLTCTLQMN